MNFLKFGLILFGLGFGVDSMATSFWEMIQAPDIISTNGHLIDALFNYTTYLNIFYFALVCIGIFGFGYLYHAKRHPKAYYTYGNKKSHILWVTVIGIAVFLTIDLNIARISNNDLLNEFWNWPNPEKEEVIKIEVLAQQWAWNFRYAGEDGVFNTEDDVTTLNDLRIPVDKKVFFHITSKDVIHSLYFPNARIKVDAIPGRVTQLWFEPTKTGLFDIACAEMCGTHHYLMKAKLTVYSEENYLAWRESARKIAITTHDPENLDMYWGWKWDLRK